MLRALMCARSAEPVLPTEYRVAGLLLRAGEPSAGRRAVWSLLWPAGAVLAELVAGELAPALRGRRVVELGCGLAAAGIAAARAGADVLLTDREADALAAAAVNAAANAAPVSTEVMDFGRVPEAHAGGFAVALAADVTYAPDALVPLVGALATLLAPGGVAWIADPHRLPPGRLAEAAAAAGLGVERWRTLPPPPLPTSDASSAQPVNIHRVTWSRRTPPG
jgi:predicted nicotinamide N-methyase